MHYLPPDSFKINWRDRREYSQARKICINCFHEFTAEALSVILEQIKRSLQIGVGS